MNNQSGQTIVEVVLAIAIIVLAMIGFMTQSTSNFLVTATSYDRMIASNLARELVEIGRAARDTNWLHGCSDPSSCIVWDFGLGLPGDYTITLGFDPVLGGYQYNFLPNTIEGCMADQSCRLYRHANGIYNHDDSGEPTKFYRLVSFLPVCENSADCGGDGICDQPDQCLSEKIGIKIISQVRWLDKEVEHNALVEDYLYNWR